jgi:hypothetical protein
MGRGRENGLANDGDQPVNTHIDGDRNVAGSGNHITPINVVVHATPPHPPDPAQTLSVSERELIKMLRESGVDGQLELLRAIKKAWTRTKRST